MGNFVRQYPAVTAFHKPVCRRSTLKMLQDSQATDEVRTACVSSLQMVLMLVPAVVLSVVLLLLLVADVAGSRGSLWAQGRSGIVQLAFSSLAPWHSPQPELSRSQVRE